jgi:hypothetical protein
MLKKAIAQQGVDRRHIDGGVAICYSIQTEMGANFVAKQIGKIPGGGSFIHVRMDLIYEEGGRDQCAPILIILKTDSNEQQISEIKAFIEGFTSGHKATFIGLLKAEDLLPGRPGAGRPTTITVTAVSAASGQKEPGGMH